MTDTQYAFRAQKASGVVDAPSFDLSAKIPAETVGSKCYAYSPNGEWLAYAMADGAELISIKASSPETKKLPNANIVALKFSPLSNFLFSFERPIKAESGEVHKNVKVWDVTNGQVVGGWYQKTMEGWEPIITANESHLLRFSSSDLTIFCPPFSTRPIVRLKMEGIRGVYISSPSELPKESTNSRPVEKAEDVGVAIWVGEHKGAPASVGLWTLSSLVGKASSLNANGETDFKTDTRDMPTTTARKAFYKADKLTVRFNAAGTHCLFLAQSDVDATGKSYYGETNLYLVALNGSFDALVELDKDGAIYDFAWSPVGREFVVCYGYMPAKTQMYDLRAKPVYSFGEAPRNFVSYQPHGKLLLSAGFGNLAGGVDLWDVSTRRKVAEFKANNASHCEWSGCGRYIMTATLSPRLRVDNGVKIWWCGGQLLHVHPIEELYQASFQPSLITSHPPFPAVLPSAPEANASVTQHRPKGESDGAASKPAGAYRPPGARNRPEGESTPFRVPGTGPGAGRPRGTPGAKLPPGAAAPQNTDDKKKRQRKKADKKEEPLVEEVKQLEVTDNAEDAVAKKVRNLIKKLKAIDELKTRQSTGEVLEKTQLKKIESEAQVRGEIKALGGTI